jgi:hypothetical protein
VKYTEECNYGSPHLISLCYGIDTFLAVIKETHFAIFYYVCMNILQDPFNSTTARIFCENGCIDMVRDVYSVCPDNDGALPRFEQGKSCPQYWSLQETPTDATPYFACLRVLGTVTARSTMALSL